MPTAPFGLDGTFGSAFIGLLVSAVLYGVTVLQSYMYFKRFPKDRMRMKFLVFSLWLLDTLHLIFCTLTVYWYLVTNYMNPEALNVTTWSMNLQTDFAGVIGLAVEGFFARRVWIMSGNWLLTAIITLLAFVHFGLGVVFTVDAFLLKDYSDFPKLVWVTCTGLGSAAVADSIIAASMCYYLSKSRTGFQHTDSLITTLMVYSFNTGLVTSVIAFISVVSFATMPTNFVWLAFFWVLGKCYVNSLLAALNSRESLRERTAGEDGTFLQLSPISGPGTPQSPFYDPRRLTVTKPSPLTVTVETATVSKTDYDGGSPIRSSGHSVSIAHAV